MKCRRHHQDTAILFHVYKRIHASNSHPLEVSEESKSDDDWVKRCMLLEEGDCKYKSDYYSRLHLRLNNVLITP